MKCDDKRGLRQQSDERWLVKIGARDMQSFLVSLPQETGKFIPGPIAQLGHRPHDFRSAWLDAPAVRRDHQATVNLAIPEGNAKVTAEDVAVAQNLYVIARLRQGSK